MASNVPDEPSNVPGDPEVKDEEQQKKSEDPRTSASAKECAWIRRHHRRHALENLSLLEKLLYMDGDERRERFDLRSTSRPMRESIIKQNDEFFQEHIKTHKTISTLTFLIAQKDYFRREETSMGAPEIMSDVNGKLIRLILRSSNKTYCKFIKCLRETDQGVVANVVEKGGAAVKIKIILEPMENIADIKKEIVGKLTQLHETNSSKSEDLWILLSQLKIGGMEILSAIYGEGIVAWVWCHSESTVTKLEQLNNDKKLGNLFNPLFRYLPVSTVPKISEIRWRRSPHAVVNRKLCKWAVKTSATMTGLKISGIAMMGNKIIAVFQNRSALLMFPCDEDGNTGPPKEELLEKIDTPMHMAVSLNLRCLYIMDRTSNNIYKVSIDLEGKADEPILWLPGSLSDQINSLSVGRNDNLLVLKEAKPGRLEICDKEALKLNQVELPIQIRYPNNAVEASNGDFVISYRSDLTQGGICRITRSGDWVSRLDLGFQSRQLQGLSKEEEAAILSLSEGNPYLKHLDHFTLDDEDQVYACDAHKYVVFLDSELNMEEAVEVNDVKNPYRIHYLKDKKELLLVHGANQDSFSLLRSI